MFKSEFIKLLKIYFSPLKLQVPLILVSLLITTACSEPPNVTTENSSSTSTVSSNNSSSSKININTASIAELDKLELPGTKPSLSERIQGARPYTSVDDLVVKKAISAEELKLIKNLVTAE